MRVFVTGASGFIGSAVVTELIGAGHHVVGLARSPASAARLSALAAEAVEAPLADLDRLHAAAASSDGVIHLAYRHGDPYEQAAETDRVAIETLGDALAGSGRPLVVTSGTLVLPAGRVGTENDKPDPAALGGARGAGERAALAGAARGVRASVVRLAPCVHEKVRRGFAGALIDIAERTGVAGYLGDGSQRWPALHRQDAARLYRLGVESAPAGSILHGVGEQGVPLRLIAELIGGRLGLPVRAIPDVDAEAHFGWLATIAGSDAPAVSTATQELLSWSPRHPGLLHDLQHGHFFEEAQR
ncbi:SDR family oxidoreductase [Actinomadura sp. NTSP31]|uniref:SDR family oxidoreductase n=1 Tax=Actinomadura sp. NTSP31 TaxID=1735447 RepID=UPI0035BF8B4D